MNSKQIFAIGILLEVFLPPGVTSFFIGAAGWSLAGVYPAIYDPSTVTSDLLFLIIVYMVPIVVISNTLYRGNARRLSLVLSGSMLVNSIAGVIAFESMLLCGFC